MNFSEPITFSPNIFVDDLCAAYWLKQVTLRLRREVCWLRYEHAEGTGQLYFTDPVQASLDLRKFWEEKVAFFNEDTTARHLTDQLGNPPPKNNQDNQGSFSWVASTLEFDDLSKFVLSLALATASDNAMGSVIAFCLNDPNKPYPTLALAQKLWNEPEKVLALVSPHHPLFRYGLLQLGHPATNLNEIDWHSPLIVSPMVVQQLLFPTTLSPLGFTMLDSSPITPNPNEAIQLVTSRLTTNSTQDIRIVPILGSKSAERTEVATIIAHKLQRPVVNVSSSPHLLSNQAYLNTITTICWLKGFDLFIDQSSNATSEGKTRSVFLPTHPIPLTIYLGISERRQLVGLPTSQLLPAITTPSFSYQERLAHWQLCLGEDLLGLEPAIADISRRFRYDKATISTICKSLEALPKPISTDYLTSACRGEVDFNVGELAQRVKPRFQDEKLILPPKQAQQFQEVLKAMQSLTEVHYRWGTATAWNEGGITALFAGASGTGKTMAAEVLAIKLDLPMYRIDLSQVVNKYIGETEKNLKKLFDAADDSDMVLFFDEADSIFGKRSEVKDAHDRYANLEISYLLERMERFKGLAILATNRKKDLDEAFLRRLRFIIDFPLPEEAQRKQIWSQVIPSTVDTSEVNLDFLAKQFRLTGGHIRSIAFNACLQSANGQQEPPFRLDMSQLVLAVKREYDKLDRNVSLEHFGPYAKFIARQEINES